MNMRVCLRVDLFSRFFPPFLKEKFFVPSCAKILCRSGKRLCEREIFYFRMPANFYFIKTACAQRNFCPLTPHTQSFSPLNFFIAIGRFAEGAYPSTAPAFRRELSFLCVSIRRKFLLTPRMLRVVISFSSFSSSLLFRRLFSEVFSAARIFKSLSRSLMLFCFPI